MKDNKRFLREIYEKVELRQKQIEQTKTISRYKKVSWTSSIVAMIAIAVGIGVYNQDRSEEQNSSIAPAFYSTEEMESTAEQFSAQVRRSHNQESQNWTIKAYVEQVSITDKQGIASILVEETIQLFQKGEQLQAKFDTDWLPFAIKQGKQYEFTIERLEDGTYVIVGGTE